MQHIQLQGTHYEMGYRYGADLAREGQYLLRQVPYPITGQRRDFARACLPIYKAHFPALLEEIRGLARGQGCDEESLQALLFSMYAIPPACGCSCFALADGEHIFLGRNSDFLPQLEEQNANVIYRFTDGAHSFTGNTTAFVEMEDGVNIHGLAVGLTSVAPAAVKPGFNAGLLVRFFLETCRTTQEVLNAVRDLPIASAQTLTVADAGGQIAVIECYGERTAVLSLTRERPFVCATNIFHAQGMPVSRPQADPWRSEERYQTLTRALEGAGGRADLSFAQALLSGRMGFLCQYDRSLGQDTVWSVLYDLREKAIHRAEGNPGRTAFVEDRRFFIG